MKKGKNIKGRGPKHPNNLRPTAQTTWWPNLKERKPPPKTKTHTKLQGNSRIPSYNKSRIVFEFALRRRN